MRNSIKELVLQTQSKDSPLCRPPASTYSISHLSTSYCNLICPDRPSFDIFHKDSESSDHSRYTFLRNLMMNCKSVALQYGNSLHRTVLLKSLLTHSQSLQVKEHHIRIHRQSKLVPEFHCLGCDFLGNDMCCFEFRKSLLESNKTCSG